MTQVSLFPVAKSKSGRSSSESSVSDWLLRPFAVSPSSKEKKILQICSHKSKTLLMDE